MRRSHFFIRRPEQLAALKSARRQEIVDVLAEMGQVSIAEIAAALGRRPDALYFHVRALQKAGLVRQAGYRYRAARKEALFETVATELRIRYDLALASSRRALAGIVQSMLRLGARDYRRALSLPRVAVSGTRRELWAVRKTGRLLPHQLPAANRALEQFVRAVSGPRGRGRLYAVTILLTPIDPERRRRRSKGSTR